ncbi:gefF [Symbiodinium microadriaticum]|nr:gefF [Symbiodinium microadriaticum]
MPSNGEGSSQVVLNSPVVEISILLEAQGKVSVAALSDLAEPILVRLSDASQQPQDVCAFFDHTSRAWSSVGLQAISVNDLSGRWCQSTHLSMLAIVHVVPFEGLIAEPDTSFELTSIALACASLFAGGGVLFLLWYYRCKPARGGSVQIQGKGDQTFVVTYSRSTRSEHEPDEPMKSISTKSLSFIPFRSEASASAASKVHIEWNIQANDWKTRLHDLEGWTGDLKQHHATQAAEVGRGRPGPASTDAPKDAPDLLATLKRAETAAMEEAERLEFLVEVDAPVPVDSLQVAEDPQKVARPSFYRNGEAVLYFSITNQCWLLARIQGDPAWMNSEEQIDREPGFLLRIFFPQASFLTTTASYRVRSRGGDSRAEKQSKPDVVLEATQSMLTWEEFAASTRQAAVFVSFEDDMVGTTEPSLRMPRRLDSHRVKTDVIGAMGKGGFVLLPADSQARYWLELSPSGTAPSERYGHTMVWSPEADGFYIFGGVVDGSRRNDVWLYARQANSWEQLSPSGTAPSARTAHTAVWSPDADGFYTFGGCYNHGELNDVWFYARQANSWEQLSPSGTAPSARHHHAMVWSPEADGFYVFGGEFAHDGSWYYLGDFWFYGRQAGEGNRELKWRMAHATRDSSAKHLSIQ